ncbi:MAG TPA: GNAT family N-acyltransferase [Bacteroidales bacterium]|nr:GNAT family N-acyltransferase [Bacteroidales bacterium]
MENELKPRVLVTRDDLMRAIKRKGILWKLITGAGMHLLSLNKLNKFYNMMYRKGTNEFIDAMFQCNNNQLVVNNPELSDIPSTGAFIVVSNHPFGGWDGVALIKTLAAKRPDIKFLVNFLIGRIEPLKPNIIEVNPFENRKKLKSNFQGLKTMHRHLSQGHPIGFFPAGEVSTFYRGVRAPMDRSWQQNIVRLIHKSGLTVIPVFIPGANSAWFHRLGKIHPLLRTIRLPGELMRLTNTEIQLHFGRPIQASVQDFIKDSQVFGSFLKMRTYAIGADLAATDKTGPSAEMEQVIDEVPVDILRNEIENLDNSRFLFTIENYRCYLAPSSEIPNVFAEISRLREISFREVGEGTGKCCDKDVYDNYYHHLFIWDYIAEKVVGAYRVGFGDQIMQQYGPNGFYTSTLFDFTSGFHPYMQHGLELGRSFVVSEYQRKPAALFLLWKGIVYVLLKNPGYKYIFGPASISNNYSEYAKILMAEYFTRNHSDAAMASHVRCKNKFRYVLYKDMANLVNYCGNDIRKLDRMVEEIDHSAKKMPVLLKKYIAQGARIIHFNVDPDFNDAIDGLMIGDVNDIPLSNIQSFVKEIEDPELMQRFIKAQP